jgi:hypothetical protein
MNTGLQDAANLGWKLAAQVQGWAAPGLLDSYHDERHPVGRRALRISGGMLRIVLSRPRRLALLTAVVARVVALPAVARRAALTVSGIGLAYPRPRGAHPLVGRRAGDTALSGGGRLFDALRDGTFVLVAARPGGAQESAHLRIVEPADRTVPTMLVRPDGYVGWAADDPSPADVHDALVAWGVAP